MPLSDHDLAAWAEYARLVRRLPGRPRPIAPAGAPASAPEPTGLLQRQPAPPARPAAPPVVIDRQPAGVDTATWQKFRSGRMAATRTLDLHGRTAHHSFHAVAAFLARARSDQVRCVEVITGRGSGEGGGVLRRELPIWLNLPELRPVVLAAAHPHPGNVGSVRLLLRKGGR